MIGITYSARRSAGSAPRISSPWSANPRCGRPRSRPNPRRLDDLRALCHATEAAYLEDHDKLAAGSARSSTRSWRASHVKFQKPAHYVSQRVDTGDIFFVVRGTANLGATDGDCAPKPLDSKLPEMAGAQAGAESPPVAPCGAPPDAPQRRGRHHRHEKRRRSPSWDTASVRVPPPSPPSSSASTPTLRCVAFATPPCLDDLACSACGVSFPSCSRRRLTRASFQNVEASRAAAEYRLEDDGGG